MRTVKQMRKELGLTQDKFSELTGIPVSDIRNWEQGVHKCLPFLNRILERMLVAEGRLPAEPAKQGHGRKSSEHVLDSGCYESADGALHID